MRTRRQHEPPVPAGAGREPEVRVIAEGDGHGAVGGRPDARLDRERRAIHARRDLDPVREREGGELIGAIVEKVRTQARDARAGGHPGDPPGLAPGRAVDRQPVPVGGEVEAVEVDPDTPDAIGRSIEAVGPWREQRQSGGATGPIRGNAAGQREELFARQSETDPEEVQLREERRGHRSRREGDRGFAAPPVDEHRGGGLRPTGHGVCAFSAAVRAGDRRPATRSPWP